MKTLKKLWPVALCAVWLLLLLPFFVGASGAHPATDDFTFALYTHPTWTQTHSILHVLKDAVSYALRTWRDWQGTIVGVIIMTLNPAVFSLEHYGTHAVLLLALDLLAWFVFLRHMLVRRLRLPRRMFAIAYLCLSACQLMFMPDVVEGIYWFNGAWFYTGAQAVSLLTLTLADRVAEGLKGKRQAIGMACCTVLLLCLGLDNYITAMMTLAVLFMMAMQRLYARDRIVALRTAMLLLPIAVGLMISVIAPGNHVRMETDGAHESGMGWFVMSVLWTLRDAAGYVVRFSWKTPLLALLCASVPLLARFAPENDDAVPPAWATLIGAYAILCGMIFPHMYSSGYAGSGRVVNMYHDFVLLALPIALMLVIAGLSSRMRRKLRSRKAQTICGVLACCALVLCLAGGQISNYVKLVSDQMNGNQAAYTRQFQREYALCDAAGKEDDVVLPAWTVQTVTGKPTAYEDETMWTNEAMAGYFGVRSVRVGE